MNPINMIRLASYLEEFVTQDMFDMSRFRRVQDSPHTIDFISKTDCGTIGCALGWCPFIEGLEPLSEEINDKHPEAAKENPILDWRAYCLRVIGTGTGSLNWNFLFSGSWDSFDNTPNGAAGRLRYLAANGDVGLLSGFDLDTYFPTFDDVDAYQDFVKH